VGEGGHCRNVCIGRQGGERWEGSPISCGLLFSIGASDGAGTDFSFVVTPVMDIRARGQCFRPRESQGARLAVLVGRLMVGTILEKTGIGGRTGSERPTKRGAAKTQ